MILNLHYSLFGLPCPYTPCPKNLRAWLIFLCNPYPYILVTIGTFILSFYICAETELIIGHGLPLQNQKAIQFFHRFISLTITIPEISISQYHTTINQHCIWCPGYLVWVPITNAVINSVN